LIVVGTWQSPPGEVTKAVLHALKSGYKHIDCATAYANEEEVGIGIAQAIKQGYCKREDIFVTSKLWCTYHRKVEQNLDECLQKLGLDYLDLFLLHWPAAMNPNGNHSLMPKLPDGTRDVDRTRSHVDTYKDMEKLLATGKTKAIGVCNYSLKYLEELLPQVSVVPAVNQVENHPLLPQEEVLSYLKSKGILLQAYSPLGGTGTPLMKDEHIQKVAAKYSVNEGTILLSYAVNRGISVIPKSVTPSRIEANMILIELDAQDMQELNDIHRKNGVTRYVNPQFGIDWGWPDQQKQA
jgi:glycerol 2-dehydrogenase (NADP+)